MAYLPPEAEKVSDIMDDTDIFNGISTCAGNLSGDPEARIKKAVEDNANIDFVPESIKESFYEEVLNLTPFSGSVGDVKVVYTPLNGTGYIPVTTVLNRAGIGQLHIVEKQKDPDPDFTSCPKPNPEEDEALIEGLKLCRSLDDEGDAPDVLIATDPDSDRLGVMVYDHGEFKRVDGNQVGILFFDYVTDRLKYKDRLPEKPVLVTTIVSTPMVDAIAQKKGVHVDRVLTGFKFIGGKINEYEAKGEADRFVFGFEESIGYLAGSYVRDKDGVGGALMISDMVGFYKRSGKTLFDRLEELYREYGYCLSEQKSIQKPGESGAREIADIMDRLRAPEVLFEFSHDVVQFLDYEAQTKRIMGLFEGEKSEGCSMAIGTRPITGIPKENVLEFNFKNRSKVIIRPSGTEPKIKIYFTAWGDSGNSAQEIMGSIYSDFMKIMGEI